MDKINTQSLNQLYKSNKTAKNTIDFLAQRKRASRITNLGGFRYEMRKAGFKCNNDELEGVLRDLQKNKVGDCIDTPRGAIESFIWNFTPHSVAMAAQDPDKHPEAVHFRKRQLKSTKGMIGATRQGKVKFYEKTVAKQPALTKLQGISGHAVFAAFVTENGEPVNLSLRKGLTKQDKATFIRLLDQVPAA